MHVLCFRSLLVQSGGLVYTLYGSKTNGIVRLEQRGR